MWLAGPELHSTDLLNCARMGEDGALKIFIGNPVRSQHTGTDGTWSRTLARMHECLAVGIRRTKQE
jgi:hypothetical protein